MGNHKHCIVSYRIQFTVPCSLHFFFLHITGERSQTGKMNSLLYIAVLLSVTILVSTRPQDRPYNEVGGEGNPFANGVEEKFNEMDEQIDVMDEDVDEMDKEANRMDETANNMDQDDEKLNRQNEGIQGPN